MPQLLATTKLQPVQMYKLEMAGLFKLGNVPNKNLTAFQSVLYLIVTIEYYFVKKAFKRASEKLCGPSSYRMIATELNSYPVSLRNRHAEVSFGEEVVDQLLHSLSYGCKR